MLERLRNKLIKIIAGKKTVVLNAKLDGKQGLIIDDSNAYIANTAFTNFDGSALFLKSGE